MKNILVAIDQRKNAEQLIDQAVKLAKLANAKIWIIHVTEAHPDHFLTQEAGPQYKYDRRTEERKEEAVIIKEWADETEKKYNLEVEGLLIQGSVAKSIKKIVEDYNIDIVVAGHRKKNLVYKLFTSNRKKDLIDDLKIPLLAVPLV